mmetsp:Transcript_66386/g.175778  ORF Transcript_66386/g.175778 Transcript_66386/m.175778 type:complete len:231 (-) Transcript_66386:149-841(-)
MLPGGTDDESNNCDFRRPFSVSCTSLKVLFFSVVPSSRKLEILYSGVLSRARMSTSFLGCARRMCIQYVLSVLGGFSCGSIVTVTLPSTKCSHSFGYSIDWSACGSSYTDSHQCMEPFCGTILNFILSLIGLSTPRPPSPGHNDRHPEEPSLWAVSFGSSKVHGAKTSLKLLPSFSTDKKSLSKDLNDKMSSPCSTTWRSWVFAMSRCPFAPFPWTSHRGSVGFSALATT